MRKTLFLVLLLLALARPGLMAQNISASLTAQAASCPASPGSSSTSSSAATLAITGPTGSVGFSLAGTFSGTVSFFSSGNNGATWQALGVLASTGSGGYVNTANTAGLWNNSGVGAYTNFCALMSSYSSGAAAVTIQLSLAGNIPSAGSYSSFAVAPFYVVSYPSVPTSDLFIGSTSANAGNASVTGTDSLGIGPGALAAMTVPASGANPQADTAIGWHACPLVTSAREMLCIGYEAGEVFVGNGQGIEDGLSTFIGSQSGVVYTGSGAANTDVFCLGQKSCVALTGGGFDIFIGNHSGYDIATATNGIFVGDNVAGIGASQAMTSSGDVIIGFDAAGAGTGAFQQNVIIGSSAALLTTATFEEVIIGNNAAPAQTTGNESTIIGYNAAAALQNGAADNFFGFDVAPTATGYNDDAFGSSACTTLTGGQYDNCFGNASAVASGNDNYEQVFGGNTIGGGSYSTTIGAQTVTVIGPNATTFGGSVTSGLAACETTFGITTLSGASTTTGLSCLPANAIIDAVAYRVTTTITTATSFTIGDSGSATRYCGTQSTLTTGTTGLCTAQGYYLNSSALGVKVTPSTTPGAGALRLMVYYHTWAAPTS